MSGQGDQRARIKSEVLPSNPYEHLPRDLLECVPCDQHFANGQAFANHLKTRNHRALLEKYYNIYDLITNILRQRCASAERKELANNPKNGCIIYCDLCDTNCLNSPEHKHKKTAWHLTLKSFRIHKCVICKQTFNVPKQFDEHLMTPGHLNKLAALNDTDLNKQYKNANVLVKHCNPLVPQLAERLQEITEQCVEGTFEGIALIIGASTTSSDPNKRNVSVDYLLREFERNLGTKYRNLNNVAAMQRDLKHIAALIDKKEQVTAAYFRKYNKLVEDAKKLIELSRMFFMDCGLSKALQQEQQREQQERQELQGASDFSDYDESDDVEIESAVEEKFDKQSLSQVKPLEPLETNGVNTAHGSKSKTFSESTKTVLANNDLNHAASVSGASGTISKDQSQLKLNGSTNEPPKKETMKPTSSESSESQLQAQLEAPKPQIQQKAQNKVQGKGCLPPCKLN